MSSLVITKESGNLFSLVLDGGEPVRSEQNRLLTKGDFCNFKTANGANIIQKQNILYSEVTIVDGGSYVPVSVTDLWSKLDIAGFFDGLASGGGGGGVDEFVELLDTFPSYLGRDGQVLIVNESEQKIETQDISLFTPEDETKLDGIEEGAQVNVQADASVTDPDDPAYIKNFPELVIISVPKIQFTADGLTDTFNIGVTAEIKAVSINGVIWNDNDWEQTGSSFTLTFTPENGDIIKPI